MTDEDDQGGADAAEAFEAMRGELALLRRAVEGLAAERGGVDIPDYSETLGHVVQGLDGINGRLDQVTTAIVKSPALAMTPAQVSAQINRAAADLRSADHAALARDAGITVRELTPTDDSLESVFTYLVQS